MTTITYSTNGGTSVIESDRDPFEVLEACRSLMFPGVEVLAFDPVFQQIIQERNV